MSRSSNITVHPAVFAAPQAADVGAAEPGEPDRKTLARSVAPLPAASDVPIDSYLREELETLRRHVELAASRLEADAAVRYRFVDLIADLGRTGRMLGEIAWVVGAADKSEASARVASAELRARLQRAPIASLFPSKH